MPVYGTLKLFVQDVVMRLTNVVGTSILHALQIGYDRHHLVSMLWWELLLANRVILKRSKVFSAHFISSLHQLLFDLFILPYFVNPIRPPISLSKAA